MSLLAKTLGIYVSWPAFAAAFGIHLDSNSLPARVPCPLCDGALHVYEDTIKNCPWHHCFDCKHSGDLIQLAQSYLELDLESTLRQLSTLGVHIPQSAFSEERLEKQKVYYSKQQGINEFWADCQITYRTTNASTINKLKNKFGLRTNVSDERWEQAGNQVIGSSTKNTIEKMFCPGLTDATIARASSYEKQRVFRGRNWEEVLVIPYRDLPERICGLFFVGREGKREDKIYRRWTISSGNGRSEFGLCCFPLALESSPGDLVAVESPLLAAKLQVRQLGLSNTPAPVVGWHDGHAGLTKHTWRLCDRRAVFWDPTPGIKTWLQAMSCDGLISTAGPDEENESSMNHYVRLTTTADLVRKIRKTAIPWRDALSTLAQENAHGWLETLLSLLQKEQVDVAQLATELSKPVRDRIELFLGTRRAEERVIELDSRARIVEKDCQWWQHSKWRTHEPVMVSNFTIKIDKIRTEGKDSIYSGRLCFKGKELDFELTHTNLVTKPKMNLQPIADAAQLGILHVRAGWDSKLVHIASMFDHPVYV